MASEKRARGSMTLRFLVVMILLAGVRMVIPTEIFMNLPDWAVTCVEVLPGLLCAIYVLNFSFPPKMFPVSSYLLMALLLVPMVVLCNVVRGALIEWYPKWTAGLDAWSIPGMLVNATSTLVYYGVVMLCFAVVWRSAFGGMPSPQPVRIGRLCSPVFWIVAYALCVALTYCDMVLHLQHISATRYQIYFGAPTGVADYFKLGPVGNLVVYWAQKPLETLIQATLLLLPMRMFRRAYLPKGATPLRGAKPETPAAAPEGQGS